MLSHSVFQIDSNSDTQPHLLLNDINPPVIHEVFSPTVLAGAEYLNKKAQAFMVWLPGTDEAGHWEQVVII